MTNKIKIRLFQINLETSSISRETRSGSAPGKSILFKTCKPLGELLAIQDLLHYILGFFLFPSIYDAISGEKDIRIY